MIRWQVIKLLAVVTIVGPQPLDEPIHAHRHARLHDGLRSSEWDSDVRLRFGMQIFDDDGAKSDQFSMSVVSKPTNTIAQFGARIQLVEGSMTNSFKLTSHI